MTRVRSRVSAELAQFAQSTATSTTHVARNPRVARNQRVSRSQHGHWHLRQDLAPGSF